MPAMPAEPWRRLPRQFAMRRTALRITASFLRLRRVDEVMHDGRFGGLYLLEFEGVGRPLEGVRRLQTLTEKEL